MFPTGRHIKIDPDMAPWYRLELFLGHHDFRVYLSDTAFVDVGRGSLRAAERVVSDPLQSGLLGTIGQFCEVAECKILAVAEHQNDLPVNLSFNTVAALRAVGNAFLAASKPFHIGNAVVISMGAILLPGSSVGDGSVIGAGSVVTRAVEPFGIYAGVPARKIRTRPLADVVASVRWWDWSTEYLADRMPDIQSAALEQGGHTYRSPSKKIIVRMRQTGDNGPRSVVLAGFVETDGTERTVADMPLPVRQYIDHAMGPGPHQWIPNIWTLA